MRTIKYTVSYEKLISRLPAMFAFVNIDEQGECRLCKATEGEQGNYNKVVADLDTPAFEHECKDGTKLVLSAGRHSYRTMIDIYYKAINDKEWERDSDGVYTDHFLAFVERGIGLKYVGLSEKESDVEKCGVKLKEEYPLAPDYIYLGEAKTLYNKVIKMKKQLDFWEKHTKLCKEDIRFRDDLKRECVLMRVVTEDGEDGDLIKELTKLIKEADETASVYLTKAKGVPNLNFSVNLNNTIKDLGMTTPYIQEWIPGRRYYHGDVVYYVDENGYGMTWECNIKDKDPHDESKDIITFVYQDELGRKYTNGQYDEETELIYFDNGKQIPQDNKTAVENWTPQSLNWVNSNLHAYRCKKCGAIFEGVKPPKCECDSTEFYNIEYINPYKCKGCGRVYFGKPNKCEECGGNIFDKILKDDKDRPNTITVNGTCNSHLTSLRRYNEYLNREDQVESPEPYKDWLWYYRKGTITNRESINDENGNIAVQNGKTVGDAFYAEGAEKIINKDGKIGFNIDFNGDTAQNLAIWGDVITDIKCENGECENPGKITFTYWLGAHLTADKDYVLDERGNRIKDEDGNDMWYTIDDDGNYKYFFKNLKYDGTSKYGKNQGVKYTESYIYYQGDTSMEVLRDFIEPIWYLEGRELSISEYTLISDENKHNCAPMFEEGEIIGYVVERDFYEKVNYTNGQIIPYSVYATLTEDPEDEKGEKNKKKCKPVEDNIWTMCERGVYEGDDKGETYIEKYIRGDFDSGYIPEEVDEEDTNAPYYYKTYEKMEFSTGDNMYVYDIQIGNRFKNVPYIRTNFETNVDIRHVDVEKTPLIRYDYYAGVNFQPSINRDVYVERGVTQAFEKHIKFSEIKSFEDLENYSNGGFFVLSKENIDLG